MLRWRQTKLRQNLKFSSGKNRENRHVLHVRVLGIRQSVRGLVFAVHCFFFVILKLRIMGLSQEPGLSVLDCRTPYRWAIPFYIHTPPMEEVDQNLPPKNQRSKVPTRAPHQKLPKFSFPLRKKTIFFQTPRKYLKDQRRRRRNDVQGPPQKISSIGGVWILNGMAR